MLIRPAMGRLVMQQLYYADEVRPIEEVPVDDADIKDGEVQLALQLIQQTAADGFHPERYEDAVKKRTLEAIEKKVQGQGIQVSAPAEPRGEVIDIMDALKASLEAARGPARAEGERPESGEPAQHTTGGRKAPLRTAARHAGRSRTGSSGKK